MLSSNSSLCLHKGRARPARFRRYRGKPLSADEEIGERGGPGFALHEIEPADEIGDILGISTRTVNFHIRNCLDKTGCRNKVQSAIRLVMWG